MKDMETSESCPESHSASGPDSPGERASASSCLPQSGPVVPDEVVPDVPHSPADPAPKKRKIEPRPVIATVHGREILEDKVGHGKKRLTTICQFHPECSKKRSQNANQTKHFGPDEPFLYLACWNARCCDFENAKQHVSWNPTKKDIQDYRTRNPHVTVLLTDPV